MRQKDFFITIRKKSEIQELFRNGKKINTKYLYVRYIISKNYPFFPVHVLFAISKKSGKAYHRNYLKRTLKESLFLFLKDQIHYFPNQTPYHLQIAITPNSNFSSLPFNEKVHEIGFFFQTIENKLKYEPAYH